MPACIDIAKQAARLTLDTKHFLVNTSVFSPTCVAQMKTGGLCTEPYFFCMSPSSGREPIKLAVISALFLITWPDESIILPQHTQENMTTSGQSSSVVYRHLNPNLSDKDIEYILGDKRDKHGMDRDKKTSAEKTPNAFLGGNAETSLVETAPSIK
jgi:hypothetical protein